MKSNTEMTAKRNQRFGSQPLRTATSKGRISMPDFRSPKMRPTTIRRRSFLATIAGLAGVLSLARRSYGAETGAGDAGRGNARLAGETAMRPSRCPAPASTIDLKTLGTDHQVASISSAGDIYRVTTVSGRTASFSEFDVRFKTDSSARGPAEGIPVLIPASIRADRAFVVFASPREISAFIERAASL